MRVRYTDEALAEVDDILKYIARDNPIAANEASLAIEHAVALIQGSRVWPASCISAWSGLFQSVTTRIASSIRSSQPKS